MKSFQLANESSPLSLSSSFILPEDRRPQFSQVSKLTSIPIIDFNNHGTNNDDGPSPLLIQKLSQACEEYGFFQVINHGVPSETCNKMMAAATEVFELPPEERGKFFTTDHTKPVKLYNFYLNVEGQGKVNMWSESFSHPWNHIEDFIHLLPKNGFQYREAFTEYAKEIRSLMNRLLSLISQGLGLQKDCLQKRLGEEPILKAQANYYPPCPDPELTLGLAVHTDLNALTVLMQSEGVTGLQVIKDGKWVAVDPVPNAFIVNLGDQIQVLSNGRYKSVHHRAVTNKMYPRVSLAMFYGPNKDSVIGPIEDLIDEEHPPMYRKYRYAEFLEEFYKQEGSRRMVKEGFQLQN
ncbi:Oxoglutarate/iron-dependent dioxygenase [Quillaja saponaria]|uniref:Oxoglutarate/iron-dependent dioxygenase n=1 Tax=Quillaja saponaria TaxID=32244 RepID=A0AAD7PG19_QUISA|nr:Oxoglutarate/iron-dependent dioxygenase [Quillaja saponaria]